MNIGELKSLIKNFDNDREIIIQVPTADGLKKMAMDYIDIYSGNFAIIDVTELKRFENCPDCNMPIPDEYDLEERRYWLDEIMFYVRCHTCGYKGEEKPLRSLARESWNHIKRRRLT
jgi:hypothetical protein